MLTTLPSSIVSVTSRSLDPLDPSFDTTCSPALRLGSNSTIVSNGTTSVSVIVWVPSRVPLPTLITAFTGLVSSFTVAEPSTTLEFSILYSVVRLPFLPSVTTSYSPFLRVSTSLIVYSKGSSSVTVWVPSVFVPTRITWFCFSVIVV